MASYIAAAGLLVLVLPGQAEAKPMKLLKIEYLVGDLPEHPQHLTVTRGGIRFESYSNLGQPGAVGIGVFERRFSGSEMDALVTALDPALIRSLPDQRGKVLSEDRWKRIRLTAEGETIEKLVGTKLPVDPALQRKVDWFDRLVEEAIRYPRSVLHFTVSDAALDSGGEFSATLTLTGSGTQRVMFRPPQGEAGAGPGSLTLYWWPHEPNVPKRNARSARVTRISAVSSGQGQGTLAAYRIRSHLDDISSRPVAVQVEYSNMDSALDAQTVVVGEFFTAPLVVP